MDELKKFLRDWRLLAPLLMLLSLEGVLQSGLYSYLLEPNSYAASVRHIVNVVRRSPVKPNVLVIGTSVAYQGILLPQLNDRLAPAGLRVQSVACQGCMLETQHRLYRELREEFPELRAVLHFGETALAWKARPSIDVANRSMLAQFGRIETLGLIREQEFPLEPWDYVYFNVRSITYQADMRDFALAPLTRFKSLTRFQRKVRDDYPYVNEYAYGIDVFGARNLQECVELIPQRKDALIAAGKTDRHHANSTLQTCQIALYEQGVPDPGAPQWNALFFRRLQRFYQEIDNDGRLIITALPPYSDLVNHLNSDQRMALWREELARLHGQREYYLLDLRSSLDGPENQSYYYDLLHLNAPGAAVWTDRIAAALLPLAPRILGERR